jgi:hypothetical protein
MSSEAPKKRGRKPGSTNKPTGPVGSRASSVRRNVTLDDYPAIQVEGGLFTVEHVRKVAKTEADKQSPADYELPAGIDLKEEIGRSFRIATALWKDFDSARQGPGDKTQATERFVGHLLKDCFGFADIRTTEPKVIAEMPYPIGRTAHGRAVPVVVVGAHQGLDVADLALGDGHRKRTASQLTQEYLNAEDSCLWAVCTNGLVIRLLRDSDSLTRQSYFEANIERILGEQLMADFAMLWLHAHASRFKPDATGPAGCPLEIWHLAAQEEGSRVRDSLRIGVEKAMVELGSGFLEHREGARLREALRAGTLKLEEYHQQVLRLVYRMLFLFAVEDRKLLHPRTAKIEQIELYVEGYSLSRLRERSIKHCHDRYDDIWDSLKVTFRGLAIGQEALGLPPLGSLFAEEQCAELTQNNISNRRLLNAIRDIAWFRENDALVPVNYKSMGTEELGSVYESLLELTPYVDESGKGFCFIKLQGGGAKGTKKKTSGSYYTPDSLVQLLLSTTLDPVIEKKLKGASTYAERENALLSIKVLDPACGSGHFLLGAARRLAEELVVIRSQSGQELDYRKALRDVISNCIHGVDRNPMAVELAKVALWIEGHVSEKPLSFLDANIIGGDSILSVIDLSLGYTPIWQKAFEANEGEDEENCRQLAKRNKSGSVELSAGGLSLFSNGGYQLGQAFAAVKKEEDNTLNGVKSKRAALTNYQKEADRDSGVILAKMYVSAYIGKRDSKAKVPTSNELFAYINGEDCAEYVAFANEVAQKAKVLIWPAAFPDVFLCGGFDVILANPPWDKITLQEEEFFSTKIPSIAAAANQSERKKLIKALGTAQPGSVERRYFMEYEEAKRITEATSAFAHDPNRYPLTGRGIVNLYALFAENIVKLLNSEGRAGLITPTGLITDSSTAHFFSAQVEASNIASVYDFENKKPLFVAVHRMFKFSLTSFGKSSSIDCGFALTDVEQLSDRRRRLTIDASFLRLVNPNTSTAPVARSEQDMKLLAKIYSRLVPFIRVQEKANKDDNPWGIELFQLFNQSTHSKFFEKKPTAGFVRLYEPKMFNIYDSRWFGFPADYWTAGGQSDDQDEEDVGEIEDITSDMYVSEKRDPGFEQSPRYWIPELMLLLKTSRIPDSLRRSLSKDDKRDAVFTDLIKRSIVFWQAKIGYVFNPALYPWADFSDAENDLLLNDDFVLSVKSLDASQGKSGINEAITAALTAYAPGYLVGYRAITNPSNRRTMIPAIFPHAASNNNCTLIRTEIEADLLCCLVGYLSSLTFDYVVRNKLGGSNLSNQYFNQLPTLLPSAISARDKLFIVPRVLELTCTSYGLKDLYRDVVCIDPRYDCRAVGERQDFFDYDIQRRPTLIAELDAYFAHMMGLGREDLMYILDPSSKEPDYPSETFRVLRDSEVKEFGEYRTQRLVLEAWDRIVEPLRRGQA